MVTSISYLAVELPACLILKRVGANILLPTMATLWGLTTTLQGLVTNYKGLLATRFFLGLAEGGLIPVFMIVMSRFYRRDQIQSRVTLIFTAGSLAGAFSGLLASAILRMDGRAGRRGWQWIFILVCDYFHRALCFLCHYCWQRTDENIIVGRDFHRGICTSILLLSPTYPDLVPVSHRERERSGSSCFRARLDA
jgi:predicted MFS family arabinose efflux permease